MKIFNQFLAAVLFIVPNCRCCVSPAMTHDSDDGHISVPGSHRTDVLLYYRAGGQLSRCCVRWDAAQLVINRDWQNEKLPPGGEAV